jgi:L-seryl-tRNA(Ser) seleniumtransferase
VSTVGGGSAPGAELPTKLVELTHDGMTADQIEQHLRTLEPPVIARILNDRVVLDLRTVLPQETERLAAMRIPDLPPEDGSS